LGIAGPVTRLTRKAVAGLMPSVIETAAAISARLGYRMRAVS
jgi:DNA-binding IclR family transcriptional regulator